MGVVLLLPAREMNIAPTKDVVETMEMIPIHGMFIWSNMITMETSNGKRPMAMRRVAIGQEKILL